MGDRTGAGRCWRCWSHWSCWARSPFYAGSPGGPATVRTVTVTLLASAALAVTGVAVLTVTARTRRVRRAVDDLVARLATPSPAAWDERRRGHPLHALRGSRRRALGRQRRARHRLPSAVVGRRLGGHRGPVGSGPPAPAGAGNSPADVLAQLAPAARLSLRNAQLAAVANARLADVRASRRRVVAASDGERRRIERDLHDGAQQRLVSAAFYLSIARRSAPRAGSGAAAGGSSRR